MSSVVTPARGHRGPWITETAGPRPCQIHGSAMWNDRILIVTSTLKGLVSVSKEPSPLVATTFHVCSASVSCAGANEHVDAQSASSTTPAC